MFEKSKKEDKTTRRVFSAKTVKTLTGVAFVGLLNPIDALATSATVSCS